MNFAGNFLHLGTVDIGTLRQQVDELTDEQWAAYALRRKRDEAHRDTQTIGLVFDPDLRHSHPTRLPALDIFHDAIYPALALVAGYYENSGKGKALTEEFGLGYFIRATLVRVMAGGSIGARQDDEFSLTHSHRVHLPIVTDDRIFFIVGKETRVLPAGELYEVNNRRLNSVHNDSSENFVQLVLDFVLPGEQCCCGKRRHPETMCSPQGCMATDRQQVPCNCYPES